MERKKKLRGKKQKDRRCSSFFFTGGLRIKGKDYHYCDEKLFDERNQMGKTVEGEESKTSKIKRRGGKRVKSYHLLSFPREAPALISSSAVPFHSPSIELEEIMSVSRNSWKIQIFLLFLHLYRVRSEPGSRIWSCFQLMAIMRERRETNVS